MFVNGDRDIKDYLGKTVIIIGCIRQKSCINCRSSKCGIRGKTVKVAEYSATDSTSRERWLYCYTEKGNRIDDVCDGDVFVVDAMEQFIQRMKDVSPETTA